VTAWLVLALVLLVHVPAGAQGDEAARARVDEVVRTTMADRHFPSAVVAVVRDGSIVNAAAYGQMRLRDAEPATPQTVYRLDSVTKQFTAAGIMLLVQDARVELDARVKRYLPAVPASWEEITIRRLLTHTSGLAHDPPNGYPPVAEQNRDPGATLARLFRMRPEFAPGSRYAYSNAGFETLAAVIHRVTGGPYLRFMRERIFDPLGMTRTTLDFFGPLEPDRAVGYRRGGAGFNTAFYRYIDARLTVLVLTNSNPEKEPGRGSPADELARLIAPLYDPDLAWTVLRPPLLNEGLEPSAEERKDAP
jgi:CubicO group peptidase (beta-lactamase class C family)